MTASEEVEQPFPLARERTVAGLESVGGGALDR